MNTKMSSIAVAMITAITASQASAADNIEESAEQSVERIQVTGSRIARINTDTPSPVVSISAAAIEATGILNANDLLSKMPQFAFGFGNTAGSSSFGNAGLNAANLRGLGTDRTLTLVNGRRIVQSTYDDGAMVTDTAMIPVQLIKRIDILTGGAAATYGADAVAGVVNFIMKDEYEGTKVTAQYGESEVGDGEELSLSLTTGLSINDGAGSLMFSIDHYNQEEASYRDRPGHASSVQWLDNPDYNADIPSRDTPKHITGTDMAWADYNVHGQMFGLWDGDTKTTNFYDVTGDEAVYMFNSADQVRPYYLQNGPNAKGHDINRYAKVNSPYERNTAYLAFNYDLTDTISLKSDLRYAQVKSNNTISPEYNYGLSYKHIDDFSSDIVLPNHINTLLEQGSGWFSTSIGLNELGPRTSDTERDIFAFSASLDGELSNGWYWNAYLSTGFTNTDMLLGNRTNKSRFSRGAYATHDEDYNRCGVNGIDCPASNPLVPMSKEAQDYVRLDPYGSQIESKQHMFSASISGDLLALPYGDLMFAAGADFRKESIDLTVDDTWQDKKLVGSGIRAPWDASKTVKEAYIELEAPVLADIFLIDELVLSAAGRLADYEYAGTNFTWKLGATWTIIDGLAMRSTLAHTVRAPQLYEQFSAPNAGWYSNIDDPCDSTEIANTVIDERPLRIANCQALGIADPETWVAATQVNGGVNGTSTGNPALKPEEAETLTVGLVYTPSFVENLSFTFDYYDIVLEDAISSKGVQTTLDDCADSENIATDIYCPLITREADGNISNVYNLKVNQAGRTRRGIDVEVSYLQELGSFGELDLTFNGTRILKNTYQNTVETSVNDITGVGKSNRKFNARLVLGYSIADFNANWTANYLDNFQVDEDGTWELYDQPFGPSMTTHDVRFAYHLDDASVYIGANNVFDESWEQHPNTSWGGLGRNYYAGLSYKF